VCVGVGVGGCGCGCGCGWVGVNVRAGALLFDICHQGHTGACACVRMRVHLISVDLFFWITSKNVSPHQSHLHVSFHLFFLDFATVIGLNLAEMRPRSC
jgi:hypothetical protein